MYRPKFISLDGAVRLIADRFAAADPEVYTDSESAVDSARMQLLMALHEGAVHAEGVIWYNIAPKYEAPSVVYDVWTPIDPGLWSHERCEKNNQYLRLDTIGVHWDENWIEYFNEAGDWDDTIAGKVRVGTADIEREFPASEVIPDIHGGTAYRTGVAGRPTSKDLALAQMERRATEGKLCLTLAAETRELCLWLKQQHPQAPKLTAKSLENSLREAYRALRRKVTETQV